VGGRVNTGNASNVNGLMPKTCGHTGCSYNVFGGGYCKMHQWKRTDRKTPKNKPKKRINQYSKKMKGLLAIYNPRAKVYKEENPYCEAKIPGICQYYTSDIHHKKGRGPYLLLEYTWMPICRMCHTWIDENPTEAREKGLVE